MLRQTIEPISSFHEQKCMIKMLKYIVLIFIVFAGCAPAPTVYYKPGEKGGELTRVYSDTVLNAPKDCIEFKERGISIKICGRKDTVYIHVFVQAGKMTSFMTKKIKWYDRLGSVI